MSQRSKVTMTSAEVWSYLRETGAQASFGSLLRDGAPHIAVMGFVPIDGERLGFLSYRKSQKVKNVERDPRATAMIESGHGYDEIRGVLVSGRVELSDDLDLMESIALALFERYPHRATDVTTVGLRRGIEERGSDGLPKRTAILLPADRVVSWDHSKLGGAY